MTPRPAAKSGFALPLTLMLVAVLTLTFAVAVGALKNLKDQTVLAIKSADFEAEQMTAEARFTYLVLTEPLGAASLDIGAPRQQATGGVTVVPDAQLFLDSRPYRWRINTDASPYVVSVQDEAGLINIYQSDVLQLTRLFTRAGMAEGDADTLANELITYKVDPTAHIPMRRLSEIYRLENATSFLSEKIWRYLQDRTTLYPDNRAVNINTASAEALSILFDLSDTQAEQVVATAKAAS